MNQTVETFLRIYIDFDQRNWVQIWFITEFVINNKNAVSTGVNFFFSGISREKFKRLTKNCIQLETKSGIRSKKRVIKPTTGFKRQWPLHSKNNENTMINLKFKRQSRKI